MSAERVDRIFSSDLRRAFETARVIAVAHALEPIADPRLREFAFGDWEGLTWAEIAAKRPHLREAERTVADRYQPEGGESFAAVKRRVEAFLESLEGADGNIVIVTHAGPMHAMLDIWNTSDTQRRPIAPGSLTRVAMERDGVRLISLNDVRHLHFTG